MHPLCFHQYITISAIFQQRNPIRIQVRLLFLVLPFTLPPLNDSGQNKKQYNHSDIHTQTVVSSNNKICQQIENVQILFEYIE